MKKYVIDIDGTICNTTNSDYENSKPIMSRIKKINKLYEEGNTIIYFTARGMGRSNNNIELSYENFYNITKLQLNKWNAKHTILLLGKPSGDYYIDDKSIEIKQFFNEES